MISNVCLLRTRERCNEIHESYMRNDTAHRELITVHDLIILLTQDIKRNAVLGEARVIEILSRGPTTPGVLWCSCNRFEVHLIEVTDVIHNPSGHMRIAWINRQDVVDCSHHVFSVPRNVLVVCVRTVILPCQALDIEMPLIDDCVGGRGTMCVVQKQANHRVDTRVLVRARRGNERYLVLAPERPAIHLAEHPYHITHMNHGL